MKQPKLMRCPFCGGSPQLIESYEGFFVICNECGTKSSLKREMSDAILSWDTRFVSGTKCTFYWLDNRFQTVPFSRSISSEGKAVTHG